MTPFILAWLSGAIIGFALGCRKPRKSTNLPKTSEIEFDHNGGWRVKHK